MTKLLEEALAELSKLPEAEQNAIAEWLLDELASERRWDKLFFESSDHLARLAEQAIAEDRSGLTEKLDPDNL